MLPSLAKLDEREEERFFYIMHRVADSPHVYADGARRVVESGGVAPGGRHQTEEWIEMQKLIYEMNGKKWTNFREENGMHQNITAFLKQLNDPSKGADSREFKGLVAWWYLVRFDGAPILSFASEDELVFRVPLSWLEKNALACLEQMPRMTGRTSYLPFAFLTALVVPLEYRITDPTPLPNEATLAMTTQEVRDYIYNAHVAVDPNIRSEAYYKEFHAAKQAERAAAEEARRNEPRVRVNPF